MHMFYFPYPNLKSFSMVLYATPCPADGAIMFASLENESFHNWQLQLIKLCLWIQAATTTHKAMLMDLGGGEAPGNRCDNLDEFRTTSLVMRTCLFVLILAVNAFVWFLAVIILFNSDIFT